VFLVELAPGSTDLRLHFRNGSVRVQRAETHQTGPVVAKLNIKIPGNIPTPAGRTEKAL